MTGCCACPRASSLITNGWRASRRLTLKPASGLSTPVQTLHPTPTQTGGGSVIAFQLLKESYDLLADPQRRRRYDEQSQLERRTPVPPLPSQRQPPSSSWDGIGERRPLSGGEWFALLLLGLALLLSLVLGLGVLAGGLFRVGEPGR